MQLKKYYFFLLPRSVLSVQHTIFDGPLTFNHTAHWSHSVRNTTRELFFSIVVFNHSLERWASVFRYNAFSFPFCWFSYIFFLFFPRCPFARDFSLALFKTTMRDPLRVSERYNFVSCFLLLLSICNFHFYFFFFALVVSLLWRIIIIIITRVENGLNLFYTIRVRALCCPFAVLLKRNFLLLPSKCLYARASVCVCVSERGSAHKVRCYLKTRKKAFFFLFNTFVARPELNILCSHAMYRRAVE